MFKKIYPMLCMIKNVRKYSTIGATAKQLFNEGLISFDTESGQFIGDFDEIAKTSTQGTISKVMTDNGVRFCIRQDDKFLNPIDQSVVIGTELARW